MPLICRAARFHVTMSAYSLLLPVGHKIVIQALYAPRYYTLRHRRCLRVDATAATRVCAALPRREDTQRKIARVDAIVDGYATFVHVATPSLCVDCYMPQYSAAR